MLLFVFLSLLSATLVSAQTPQSDRQTVRLLIKKGEMKMDVVSGESVTQTFPIAIGKNPGNKQKRGDKRTPEGKFVIVQIQNAGYWTHDFGDGKGSIPGAYGPWFLRLGSGKTEMKWKGIGIHGTHDPASIGSMATEGCIRLRNEDLNVLKNLVRVGTIVEITP